MHAGTILPVACHVCHLQVDRKIARVSQPIKTACVS